ncbi:MAG: glutathione S-transferase [Gammaproteobacteria bacterium]|jgi:glutathione S-transferase
MLKTRCPAPDPAGSCDNLSANDDSQDFITMILYGRYLSPFVRRTAIVFRNLGLPYEHSSSGTDSAEVAEHNPLRRVPTLALADGEVIIDSAAMIDYALEQAGGGLELLPARGAPRRVVLRVSAIATGVMEKSVASAYERSKRPKDKIHKEWLDQLDAQVVAGLGELDGAAAGKTFLCDDQLTLADINAVVAYDFAVIAVRYLFKEHHFNALQDLSARCNQLPEFVLTQHKSD